MVIHSQEKSGGTRGTNGPCWIIREDTSPGGYWGLLTVELEELGTILPIFGGQEHALDFMMDTLDPGSRVRLEAIQMARPAGFGATRLPVRRGAGGIRPVIGRGLPEYRRARRPVQRKLRGCGARQGKDLVYPRGAQGDTLDTARRGPETLSTSNSAKRHETL